MTVVSACDDGNGDETANDTANDTANGTSASSTSSTSGESESTGDVQTQGTDGDDTSSGDTSTNSCETEPDFECENCGDQLTDPICVDGEWACEPPGPCPEVECDGTNDDEAPECVDNCEDQVVVGMAECFLLSGQWDCGDNGVRLDQCKKGA